MAYLDEDIEVIFYQQQLELEIENAIRERLDQESRDYAEYVKDGLLRNFREKDISFAQWCDMKYKNVKNIRKWTRKRLKDTTCL